MEKNIIAHRGYSFIAPENTMLAFDIAHLFGFDGIEIDVHQTKDGELVVIHDETINRTSNKKGHIRKLSLKEIKKANFASKFDPKCPKQTIMTFKEFLKRYGNKFKILNVEIKTNVIEYEGIERKILETEKAVKPKAEIMYSSFNFNSLIRIKTIDKTSKTAFLFDKINLLEEKEELIESTCNYLNPWFKLLKGANKKYINSFKLPLNVWTMQKVNSDDIWSKNSNKEYKKLSKMKSIYSFISNSRI